MPQPPPRLTPANPTLPLTNAHPYETCSFDTAVPGAKSARDILEHFDEYARGDGRLQRTDMSELGIGVFEVAAMFWGGGYDPAAEVLSEGRFVLAISRAIDASQRLHAAIYRAARAVDASRGLA
jgi:hypothetical protein